MSKRRKKRSSKKRSLRGLGSTNFDLTRLNTQKGIEVGKTLLYGLAGNVAGNFIGAGGNKIAGAALALASIAAPAYADILTPVAIGAFVSTPESPTYSVASTATGGMDGLKELVSTEGPARAKSVLGKHLNNLGLKSLTAKMGLGEIEGLEGDYDVQGFEGLEGDDYLGLLDEIESEQRIGGVYLDASRLNGLDGDDDIHGLDGRRRTSVDSFESARAALMSSVRTR